MTRDFNRLLTAGELLRFDQALQALAPRRDLPSADAGLGGTLEAVCASVPSPQEERIWLRQQQEPEAVLKHVVAWQFTGAGDPARLIAALCATIDALGRLDVRYRFDEDAELRAYVGRCAANCVRVLPVSSGQDALRALLAEQDARWDLEHVAPVRFLVLLAPDSVILGLVAHQILDGVVRCADMLDTLSHVYDHGTAPAATEARRAGPAALSGGAAWEPESTKSVVPWLARSQTAAPDVVDFGRASLLDNGLRGRAAMRHGVRLDATCLAHLLGSSPTPRAVLAALAVLFGRFLAGLGGEAAVVLALTSVPGAGFSDLGWSLGGDRLRVRVPGDDVPVDEAVRHAEAVLEQGATGIPRTGAEAGPPMALQAGVAAWVTWLSDPADDLRLEGAAVARLPLPSLEQRPDLELGVGWSRDGRLTLELMTGQGVSAAAGELLLERFAGVLQGEAASPMPGWNHGADLSADRAEAAAPQDTREHDAPRDDVEWLILAEFRRSLSSPAMTADDDFFDHGGHSLIATRIIGRLLSLHGIEVRFNDLFSHPTAAGLSQRALRHGVAAGDGVVGAGGDDTLSGPLSLAQMSLWKAYEAFGCGEVFNLPFALRFLDPVDEALFERAFLDVMARHPGLRTLFRKEAGEVRQHVVPLEGLSQYKWFWSSGESIGVERRSEASHRFDLARELPLRLRFLTDAETGQQILSFLFHHVVLDEWSVNLMMDELDHAYRQREAGLEPLWETSPPPFHAFARAQREAGLNAAHLAYWTETLRGAPQGQPIFARPPLADAGAAWDAAAGNDAAQAPAHVAVREAGPNEGPSSSAGGWVECKLEPAVCEGLYGLARENSASLFNVVYTAIALSIHILGEMDDLVIGTSASGRNDTAFFDTIGYFTTVVAHRVRFSERDTLGDLIGQVKASINESLPYTDIPIDIVEEALGMSPGKEHLFEIFIQIHAKNKFNGAFNLMDGRQIAFCQVDPDREESLLGLHFEVMEEMVAGARSIRVLMSFRSDHYSPQQVERLRSTTSAIFSLFARPGSASCPLSDFRSAAGDPGPASLPHGTAGGCQ